MTKYIDYYKKRNKILMVLLVFLLVLFTFLPSITVFSVKKDVKVGFVNGYGINKIDNVYSGYVFEYLREIEKHTDITFSFVEGDLLNNIEKLKNNEIDLIVPLQKKEKYLDELIYSNLELGHEYESLFTKTTNNDLYFDDYSNFNGMRVGAFAVSEDFNRYKRDNDFMADYVFFDDAEEMHEALFNNQIDAFILESTMVYKDVKIIANLSSSPYYVASHKRNQDLINQIDNALEKIKNKDIYFSLKLYERFYEKNIFSSPAYTQDELEFIKKKKQINISFDSKLSALEYYDKDNKNFSGIIPDIVREVAKKSGLNINFFYSDSFEQGLAMLDNGTINALSSSVYDLNNCKYKYTDSIFTVPFSFLFYKNQDSNKINDIVVYNKYKDYLPLFEHEFPDYEFTFLESNNIDSKTFNENSALFINTYTINYLKSQGQLKDLDYLNSSQVNIDSRLVFSSDCEDEFISIFNKTLKRISISEINNIIVDNTSFESTQSRFKIYLVDNIYLFIAIVFFVVIIITVALIFANKKVNQRLYKMAYFDTLTKAPNITKLRIDAQKIYEKNEQDHYILVYFDAKNFKYINELLGYKTGNLILINIANLCKSQMGEHEYFARLSSDVFVLFIRRNLDEALKLIEGFDYHLQNLDILEGVALKPTFVWGVYQIPDTKYDFEYALDRANYARKLVKNSANMNICIYDDIIKSQEENAKLIENSMHMALGNNEFKVFLQPKYDLKTKQLVGGEALVRWCLDDMVKWFPDDFISLFEKNGFIVDLDTFMLKEVCRIQSEWLRLGYNTVPISINQSKLLISKNSYVLDVLNILQDFDLPPNLLEIELTETIFHDNLNILLFIMEKLQSVGIRFSIDDFGSGYSSLQLLNQIPANVLKIDKSILNNAVSDKRSKIILSNIINMAESFGMETVCEGVETKEHEKLLNNLGCNIGQGYLYGKAMDVDHFEKLLNKY